MERSEEEDRLRREGAGGQPSPAARALARSRSALEARRDFAATRIRQPAFRDVDVEKLMREASEIAVAAELAKQAVPPELPVAERAPSDSPPATDAPRLPDPLPPAIEPPPADPLPPVDPVPPTVPLPSTDPLPPADEPPSVDALSPADPHPPVDPVLPTILLPPTDPRPLANEPASIDALPPTDPVPPDDPIPSTTPPRSTDPRPPTDEPPPVGPLPPADPVPPADPPGPVAPSRPIARLLPGFPSLPASEAELATIVLSSRKEARAPPRFANRFVDRLTAGVVKADMLRVGLVVVLAGGAVYGGLFAIKPGEAVPVTTVRAPRVMDARSVSVDEVPTPARSDLEAAAARVGKSELDLRGSIAGFVQVVPGAPAQACAKLVEAGWSTQGWGDSPVGAKGECLADRSYGADGQTNSFAVLRGGHTLAELRIKLNLGDAATREEAGRDAGRLVAALFETWRWDGGPALGDRIAALKPFEETVNGTAVRLTREYGDVERLNLLMRFPQPAGPAEAGMAEAQAASLAALSAIAITHVGGVAESPAAEPPVPEKPEPETPVPETP